MTEQSFGGRNGENDNDDSNDFSEGRDLDDVARFCVEVKEEFMEILRMEGSPCNECLERASCRDSLGFLLNDKPLCPEGAEFAKPKIRKYARSLLGDRYVEDDSQSIANLCSMFADIPKKILHLL